MIVEIKKQSLEVLHKKGVFKYFAKFTEKNLCRSPFFNKFVGLICNLIFKKRTRHKCFPVHLTILIATPS